MIRRIKRLDAPFWAIVLVGLFSIGTLGAFGVAAFSQSTKTAEAEILDTNNFQPPADL